MGMADRIFNPIFRNPNTFIDEIWLPITTRAVPEIYAGYMVSNYGRIYRMFDNSYLVGSYDSKGYLKVHFITSNGDCVRKIHRVVMLTFAYINGCEYLEVDHKDGIKVHNWIWNLDWVTSKENTRRAITLGLKKVNGSCNPNAVITEEQALLIKDLIIDIPSNKYTYTDIGNIVGCSKNVVRQIAYGNNWRNLFTEEELKRMKEVVISKR